MAAVQPQELAETLIELVEGQQSRRSPRDHDEIDVLAKLGATSPKPLTRTALESIADDSPTDLAAHGDAETTPRRPGFL